MAGGRATEYHTARFRVKFIERPRPQDNLETGARSFDAAQYGNSLPEPEAG